MKTHGTPWTLLALAGLLAAPVAEAADDRFSVPGTACGAFINSQADKLERQQARIYNPVSNPQSLWVICPVQSPEIDDDSSWDFIQGWVNVFWNSGTAAGSKVDCAIRQYAPDNIHVPTVSLEGILSVATLSSTVNLGEPPPYVDDKAFNLPSPDPGANYITVSCLLAPGSGINSIDLEFGESS